MQTEIEFTTISLDCMTGTYCVDKWSELINVERNNYLELKPIEKQCNKLADHVFPAITICRTPFFMFSISNMQFDIFGIKPMYNPIFIEHITDFYSKPVEPLSCAYDEALRDAYSTLRMLLTVC